MHTPDKPTPLRKARLALGLTTTEAGQYVHVTRKTWEAWEAGEMDGKAAPAAKVELFFTKLNSIGESRNKGVMVVVFYEHPGTGFQQPIDVVAEDNYLGRDGDIIKSMAIRNGRPYVHRTKFDPAHNPHVVKFCNEHEPA
ncbi:helix-turn-helix domain-containing protein [Hafnia alvei]|uniref:helix-turn-helix domain-containing protein n=1 Tax=Hafnia alvei TaxID=569 RepID=UPI0024A8BBC3|nr:helix-turn-helix transcriptional regulator [Hafnia alvei]